MPLNGIRNAAIVHKMRDQDAFEVGMPPTLRKSIHLVSNPANLDLSVNEVFDMMLGVACARIPVSASIETETVTAVVGFGGMLSGACIIKCGSDVAIRLAAQMSGMDFTCVNDTVKDGIGEICNMLAGAWKGKVPDLSAHCGLSLPAVITGHDYNLHVQSPEFQLHHLYHFGESEFSVTIVCDGIQ